MHAINLVLAQKIELSFFIIKMVAIIICIAGYRFYYLLLSLNMHNELVEIHDYGIQAIFLHIYTK